MTIRWGVGEAIKSSGRVTDLIYHTGDYGKEPMTLIFGFNAVDVVKKFQRILNSYLPSSESI
ncbi:MAG: hypothetical protein NZ733_00995, partial [Aigarchaeota archaeon]|nr:hypothetical protein [Aigarchaeota archaeon]